MKDCLFCKIANKEVDREIVFENDKVIAFKYTNPQAPIHLILFPKEHAYLITDVEKFDSEVINELLKTIFKIAEDFKLTEFDNSGLRITTSFGALAGQGTKHFHLHVLGWPPD